MGGENYRAFRQKPVMLILGSEDPLAAGPAIAQLNPLGKEMNGKHKVSHYLVI